MKNPFFQARSKSPGKARNATTFRNPFLNQRSGQSSFRPQSPMSFFDYGRGNPAFTKSSQLKQTSAGLIKAAVFIGRKGYVSAGIGKAGRFAGAKIGSGLKTVGGKVGSAIASKLPKQSIYTGKILSGEKVIYQEPISKTPIGIKSKLSGMPTHTGIQNIAGEVKMQESQRNYGRKNI